MVASEEARFRRGECSLCFIFSNIFLPCKPAFLPTFTANLLSAILRSLISPAADESQSSYLGLPWASLPPLYHKVPTLLLSSFASIPDNQELELDLFSVSLVGSA